ncbi:hypothetical protein TNCV_2836661 [Trichonephila clavipes]|nr:hypothetical protein TNCV_2836661 [Trichonephila clavipes]
MRSHRYSMGSRSREFAGQGGISYSVSLLRVHHTTCSLAPSYWNTVLGVPCNKGRTTGSTRCAEPVPTSSGRLSNGHQCVPEAPCDQILCHPKR